MDGGGQGKGSGYGLLFDPYLIEVSFNPCANALNTSVHNPTSFKEDILIP
jgi:hypothetical protein